MEDPLDLRYPFGGKWLVRNSPADRVPSHGTAKFGSAFAIDFVPVGDDDRSAPYSFASFFRPEPTSVFPGLGRPVVAPLDGVVVGAHASEPDHDSYRGLPSVGYALTQRRRLRGGWRAMAGNFVLIEGRSPDRTAFVALCHLQEDSVMVAPGQVVRAGEEVGRCGNSGNSTEPHLHLQVVDARDVARATAVPITFEGRLPRNGEVVDAP